jgi:hypothetical protein
MSDEFVSSEVVGRDTDVNADTVAVDNGKLRVEAWSFDRDVGVDVRSFKYPYDLRNVDEGIVFWLHPREAVGLALRLLNCAEEATRGQDDEADR